MSAQKIKPSSVLGGILGLVGFSVLAGVLVTAMVTPSIAVTSLTAQGSIDIFENLPDSIKIGLPSQQNQIIGVRGGKPVLLATIYKQNRVVVAWEDVSPFLKQAAVDGEDRRFFDHGGVDVPSIARAALQNVSSSSIQSGSSTLDMQLVKNILVQDAFTNLTGDERTAAIKAANGASIDRKLKEMKLAIGLDKTYTKNEILLGYLNIVGMGSTTYGVESAARQYFGVSAKDVTLPQAASLVAIVQSPGIQNLSDPKYYPANKTRRDEILKSMYTAKDITLKQRDDALATPIASYVKLTAQSNGCRTATDPSAAAACDYATQLITANPVATAVAAQKAFPRSQNSGETDRAYASYKASAPAQLAAAVATAKMNETNKVIPVVGGLGATPAERLANWNKGGYKIYLSLDLDLQDAAQKVLEVQAPPNENRFQLGSTADTVEGGTGRILVMAQNKIWDNAAAAGATLTSAYNFSVDRPYGGASGYETGSTYKMFDLANWLQIGNGLYDTVNGRGPQTYSLSNFTAPCEPGVLLGAPFTLQNDGNSSGDYMSVKYALMGSVNNAFMNMAEKQDLCAIRDTAKSMGAHRADFKTDLNVGPSNILGTNEQAPLTMAGAAATIGAGGVHCAPIMIDKVVDPEGKEQPGQSKTCSQALTPEVAAGVANAMIGSMTGGTSSPANTRDGVPIGGKTGTSPELEQDWVISTTTTVGSSVWTGNWDSAKKSLNKYTNPITRGNYYYTSRFNIMRTLMLAVNANSALKGGAFPTPTASTWRGNSSPVPDVTGQSVAQATKVLTSLQFQVTVGGSEASALPAGRVTRTNPAAGSNVDPASTITIYTSDGTLSTTMPDVVGMTRQVATTFLTNNAGFSASNITFNYVKGNPLPAQKDTMCLVQSTNPAAGATASKSDAVKVTVYGTADGKDPGPLCTK